MLAIANFVIVIVVIIIIVEGAFSSRWQTELVPVIHAVTYRAGSKTTLARHFFLLGLFTVMSDDVTVGG